MRNILSAIFGCLLVMVSLKAIELGVCYAKMESNREMIQKANRRISKMTEKAEREIQKSNVQTARKYLSLRKTLAPCDTMDFVILEDNHE